MGQPRRWWQGTRRARPVVRVCQMEGVIAGGLEPFFALFLETPADDALERCRD